MKTEKTIAISLLCLYDVYIWRITELSPHCAGIAWSMVLFSLALQVLWSFFILNPHRLIEFLMIYSTRPFFSKKPLKSTTTVLAITMGIFYAVMSLMILSDALKGGYRAGGFHCSQPISTENCDD